MAAEMNTPELRSRNSDPSGAARGTRSAGGPSVGVIIPTYNRAALVMQAVDSVLNQTHPVSELIVVDDGSTDDTEVVLRRYADRLHYVYQSNAGKPAALNRALSMLDTEYVWILDDDDVAVADALERHLRYLSAHPETDFTYSGVWCFSGTALPMLERCHLWQRYGIPHDLFFVRALEEFPCNQQTMLVPLECYRAVGPYDEQQRFGEDYDMILRLARRYRAGCIEQPTIFLRQHGGDRGPAQERFASAQRFDRWRPYEIRLFRHLREELALAEYLPRATLGSTLNQSQIRRALLQRACVMARHGLFEPALDDLGAAVSHASGTLPWSADERRICGQMVNVEPVVLEGQRAFLRQASRLLRRSAPDLHQAAAAGLTWGGMAELRAGRYLNAARMGARFARWARPRDVFGMVAAKLLPKAPKPQPPN